MSARPPRVLAVVTARGGSKGLPGKNLRPLGGRPLICWTIEAALKADCVGRVVLSTDDPEIARVGRAAGAEAPFMRPNDLATDTATSGDVLRHALEACPGYDIALLLQPTSPLRGADDIDAAFATMLEAGASSCVSVCEAKESPYLMYRLGETGRLGRMMSDIPAGARRQDFPPVYMLNGAIYFVTVQAFLRTGQIIGAGTVAYAMSHEASVDIDTAEDFAQAEAAIATLLTRNSP